MRGTRSRRAISHRTPAAASPTSHSSARRRTAYLQAQRWTGSWWRVMADYLRAGMTSPVAIVFFGLAPARLRTTGVAARARVASFVVVLPTRVRSGRSNLKIGSAAHAGHGRAMRRLEARYLRGGSGY